jgi:redox-sensitive bicupin YhaK (pirin superfamily)
MTTGGGGTWLVEGEILHRDSLGNRHGGTTGQRPR